MLSMMLVAAIVHTVFIMVSKCVCECAITKREGTWSWLISIRLREAIPCDKIQVPKEMCFLPGCRKDESARTSCRGRRSRLFYRRLVPTPLSGLFFRLLRIQTQLKVHVSLHIFTVVVHVESGVHRPSVDSTAVSAREQGYILLRAM